MNPHFFPHLCFQEIAPKKYPTPLFPPMKHYGTIMSVYLNIQLIISNLLYSLSNLGNFIFFNQLIYIIKENYMSNQNPLINYSQYESHFNDNCTHIKSCNDLPCTVILLLLTLAFIGIGVYEITQYNFSDQLNGQQLDFKQYWDVILLALVASVGLSFLYVFLVKMFTKIMVYFSMVMTLAVFAVLAIYGIIIGQIWLTISMGITLLIYLLVLACLRNKIALGIVLLQLATKFMSERPSVFFAPFINMIITFVIGIFYTLTLSIIIANFNNKDQRGEDTGMQIGFMAFYGFMWLFLMFLCYYIMTFTIATICSYWYYNLQGSPISTSYKWIFTKQIGSLSFAALIIAIVTFARMLVDGERRNNKNIAVAVCLCIVRCLLKAIEDLLKVINHYTVIMMALTGQPYVPSAKSTMGLLFQELGLLNISNIICNFLIIWGIALSVGLPALIAAFVVSSRTGDDDEITYVILIVVFLCMMVSMMIYQILIESVGCMFMFYAMDKRFMSMGIISQYRLPNQMHQKLNYGVNPYGTRQTY